MSEIKISTGHPDAGRIYAEALDRVTAERDALQALLTAADEELDRAGGAYLNKNAECLRLRERADVLEGLLSKCATDFEGVDKFLMAFHAENESHWCWYLEDCLGIARFRGGEIRTALKPAEGGGDD